MVVSLYQNLFILEGPLKLILRLNCYRKRQVFNHFVIW